MKKLFKNYSFEFDKNEKKILLNFSRQILKQLETSEGSEKDARTFMSIIDKLTSNEDTIKLTKEEKTKLVLNLKANVKQLNEQKNKSWILKKWLISSVYNQYSNILKTHFDD